MIKDLIENISGKNFFLLLFGKKSEFLIASILSGSISCQVDLVPQHLNRAMSESAWLYYGHTLIFEWEGRLLVSRGSLSRDHLRIEIGTIGRFFGY